MIVHHHAILVATVTRRPGEISCDDLQRFLSDLVREIGMQKIFEPIAIKGKFGFTGIVGIVTSHIAFHFFDADQSLHLDVYSCKKFDLERTLSFINSYWSITTGDVIFIERDAGPRVEKFRYEKGTLRRSD